MIRKPWLWLPANWSHNLTPLALKIYSKINPSPKPYLWKSFHWRDLYFPNPLGTAGGIDKNALNIKDWWRLGAGFCEVGTITAKPQNQNPGKVLDRDIKTKSLWNSLGFPNKGLEFALSRLKTLPPPGERSTPVFANIGKNRDTPLDRAYEDYKTCIEALCQYVEAFVINISSPNTKNLRELFRRENLTLFLESLKSTNTLKRPLILKISPDLSEEDFLRVIEQSLKAKVDGWCICNSTAKRDQNSLFPSWGGISGGPLRTQSLHFLKLLKAYLNNKTEQQDKLIISTGGVLTPEEVLERLNLGAHLVQVYSALVFTGPGFFKQTYQKALTHS